MAQGFDKRYILVSLLSTLAIIDLELPVVSEAGTPRDLIATKIRSQGFDCDQPVKATKDVRASKAHEAVWELQCKNATYRVRLIPGRAAKVQRISD